jgi:YYY domain-containing protein
MMIADWFAREGWIVLNWWLLLTVAGFTVLPLTVRLLDALPDNGYSLARPIGLLFITLVYWLLGMFQITPNTTGSVLLAWVIVLGISILMYIRPVKFEWRVWWRENRALIITIEIVFFALFMFMTVYRAHQNELISTEKPMDLAFMSAIQRSPDFPPDDPWLAGYSISYYYMGYVMGAMTSKAANLPSTIGYNLHLATLFALAGSTVLGVVYNMIRAHALRRLYVQHPTRTVALGFGILATFFLMFMSNGHMVMVEMPYRGMIASDDYLRHLDTKGRSADYDQNGEPVSVYNIGQEPINIFDPSAYPYWWWFDASRTITERALDKPDAKGGRVNEVIDEFPSFSFILGDSHPHVMALPFVLLAIGLALNVILSSHAPTYLQTTFYGIFVGSLVFLNTWDAPIYIVVLVGAELLRRLAIEGRGYLILYDWLHLLYFGARLIAIMIVVYFPFLISFQSQLGGILPNPLYPTRPQQMLVMWTPFLALISIYLILEMWRGMRAKRMNWGLGLTASGGIILFLAVAMVLMVDIALKQPQNSPIGRVINDFTQSYGGLDPVVNQVIQRRIETALTPAVMGLILLIVVARLFPRFWRKDATNDFERITYSPPTGLALLLLACGTGLVLIPEFLYLRDNFGWRMNTVFKFYYQAWVMFSIVAAYGVYSIVADRHGRRFGFLPTLIYILVVVMVVGLGAFYPVFGFYHRMFVETGRVSAQNPNTSPLTLDSGPTLISTPDYQALMCLAEKVGQADVVIAEARPQGNRINYNVQHGRAGTLTGIPVILGWQGHQSQWRGDTYTQAVGTRESDLDILYTSTSIADAMSIIQRYGIDYILYGTKEREYYGTGGEAKFLDNFEVICISDVGNTRIYRVIERYNPFAGR